MFIFTHFRADSGIKNIHFIAFAASSAGANIDELDALVPVSTNRYDLQRFLSLSIFKFYLDYLIPSHLILQDAYRQPSMAGPASI